MEGVQPRAVAPEEESSCGGAGGLWRYLSEASTGECGVTIVGASTPRLLTKNIPSSVYPVIWDSQAHQLLPQPSKLSCSTEKDGLREGKEPA